jgi:uncharacterized protein YdcH (DUF465 family)
VAAARVDHLNRQFGNVFAEPIQRAAGQHAPTGRRREPQLGVVGAAELVLKKTLWKLLKFYTFRLFSQQREFNSQVSYTLAAIHKDYTARVYTLQKQILALKDKVNNP